jgi:hypothetical protein
MYRFLESSGNPASICRSSHLPATLIFVASQSGPAVFNRVRLAPKSHDGILAVPPSSTRKTVSVSACAKIGANELTANLSPCSPAMKPLGGCEAHRVIDRLAPE